MKLKLALFCGLALAGVNAMACYTVYDRNDRVIYQGTETPVDMSLQLHETLGQRFPGAHMVFDLSTNCTPVRLSQVARPVSGDVPPGTIRMEGTGRSVKPSSSAPLLTDVSTAQRQNLPHTVMGGNIAMVPAQVAARLDLPTFTVIPADVAVARAPAPVDTRAMGAGPATQQQTVITEMRDGSTMMQRGNNLSLRKY
jgi:hypothetical protein